MKHFIASVLLSCLVFLNPNTAAAENKLESWYAYWGAGWASLSYPAGLSGIKNEAGNLGLDNMFPMTLDMLGFYWPRGEKMVIGCIWNAAGEYEGSPGATHYKINSHLVSVSTMYFLSNRIGKGPFVRFDIGPAKTVLETSFSGDLDPEWGPGVLFGAGVGIPVASGTRLLLNAHYTVRRAGGGNLKILGLTAGFLL